MALLGVTVQNDIESAVSKTSTHLVQWHYNINLYNCGAV